ncbi:HIT family protein [Dyella sp. ASV21]|jgi:histidine triad (HIT) family protein|uniref:HIT family protein n=1 Tax=Dyella sp. ASV21 TaxID=2795114 RepID=UPI0018EAE16C|nr:HIT family protein [Dyella sp. ASV21]
MRVDCPFCAIVAGRQPASVIAQNEQALAFLDLRQAVPGHVLVVPRVHVETLYDLDEVSAAAVMQLGVRVARALRVAFDPEGLNLWQSNGAAGGQEVPHLHLHVQPRRMADGLLRVYPHGAPTPTSRDELERLAERVRPLLWA